MSAGGDDHFYGKQGRELRRRMSGWDSPLLTHFIACEASSNFRHQQLPHVCKINRRVRLAGQASRKPRRATGGAFSCAGRMATRYDPTSTFDLPWLAGAFI
jgi:hypothetical protein